MTILEDPYVLLYDKKVANVRDLLRSSSRWQRPDGRCSSSPRHRERSPRELSWSTTCAASQDLRGQGPGFGDRRKPCSRTSPFSPAARSSPKKSPDPREGIRSGPCQAKRVEIDKEETTLIDGAGDPRRSRRG